MDRVRTALSLIPILVGLWMAITAGFGLPALPGRPPTSTADTWPVIVLGFGLIAAGVYALRHRYQMVGRLRWGPVRARVVIQVTRVEEHAFREGMDDFESLFRARSDLDDLVLTWRAGVVVVDAMGDFGGVNLDSATGLALGHAWDIAPACFAGENDLQLQVVDAEEC